MPPYNSWVAPVDRFCYSISRLCDANAIVLTVKQINEGWYMRASSVRRF